MLTLMMSGKDQAAARELLSKRYDNRRRQALQSSSDDVFQLYMNAVAQADPCIPPTFPLATPRISTFKCVCRWKASAAYCEWKMNK